MGAPYFQSRPDIIVIQLDKILQAIGIAVEFRRSDIVVKEKRNAGDANSSIPCEASSLARRRVLINIFRMRPRFCAGILANTSDGVP